MKAFKSQERKKAVFDYYNMLLGKVVLAGASLGAWLADKILAFLEHESLSGNY